jgi:hypothetical protein
MRLAIYERYTNNIFLLIIIYSGLYMDGPHIPLSPSVEEDHKWEIDMWII